MARLYVFAIGGTGSRVLKSLAMLLASGVKPESNTSYEIVPIIIDPHKVNEDLKRTKNLLNNYQKINEKAGSDNGFFGTKITTLDKLVDSENRLNKDFTYNLQEVGGKMFKEYIGYSQLDKTNKAFMDILFSGKSINKRHEEVNLLDVEMDIGFVGNPNIGSVVLNQFRDSNEFKEFASNYNEDDRIFIISSIFGGTGAAGFPTILKNIRSAKTIGGIAGVDFLENAKIGAVSVLPYFNIEVDNNSPIQKSDFIAKTKSALYYYKENVNKFVNALYYVGDDYIGNAYKNDPGDGGQKNDAHFVELISALSIIDFLEIPGEELVSNNGKAESPIYKEFGIKKDKKSLAFSDLADDTERKIALSLSQFSLFKKYIDEHLDGSIENVAWSNDTPEINRKFKNDSFFRSNLSEFLLAYQEWLNEMAGNERGFSPFNFNSSIDSFIKDKSVKKGWLNKKVNYPYFDNELNSNSKKNSYASAEAKFLKLFYETTQEILTTKFGLK
jgi:hypothetical protein